MSKPDARVEWPLVDRLNSMASEMSAMATKADVLLRLKRAERFAVLTREAATAIAALQSRLDAVGRLSDEWEAGRVGASELTARSMHAARMFANELRSAALGGESPGNDEVVL